MRLEHLDQSYTSVVHSVTMMTLFFSFRRLKEKKEEEEAAWSTIKETRAKHNQVREAVHLLKRRLRGSNSRLTGLGITDSASRSYSPNSIYSAAMFTLHSPATMFTLHSPAAMFTLHSPAAMFTLRSPAAMFTLRSPAAMFTLHSPATMFTLHSPPAT